jgi:hypothetical protein
VQQWQDLALAAQRSVKSAACNRLKVNGVNDRLFFPFLVMAFTSGEEFHSVW